MKISNNTVAVLSILLILVSSINITNFLGGITLTGKSVSAIGTAKIMVLQAMVPAPLNLDAFVNSDGKSIDLNWTNVSSAEYYVVFYSSNLSKLVDLNLSNIPPEVGNMTNIVHNYVTDYFADSVRERYYKVASVKGSMINISEEIVGKYTYTFYGISNPSNAHRAENWMSVPFNISFTAESFMDSIPNNIAEKLTKLIRQDNETYQFYTHIHNLNDGKNFYMKIAEGYALFTNQTGEYTVR